jgi:heptaprenyl diphosphate synthase
MSLQDRIKRLVYSALFLAIALVLSIVEAMFSLSEFVSLPGVKFGLCNVATTAAFYTIGKRSALYVTVLRPVFMFLLFSNPFSFVMSMTGGLFAYASLFLTKKMYNKSISFCAVSCIGAVFHSIGQCIAASIVLGNMAMFLYLPLFAGASSVMGSISGVVMNIAIPRIKIQNMSKEG